MNKKLDFAKSRQSQAFLLTKYLYIKFFLPMIDINFEGYGYDDVTGQGMSTLAAQNKVEFETPIKNENKLVEIEEFLSEEGQDYTDLRPGKFFCNN